MPTKSRLQIAAAALLTCGLSSGLYAARPAAGKTKPSSTPIIGVSIHHCSCAVGCPCMFGPQLSDCRMVMVHHVDRGSMNGLRLDGATVVAVYPSYRDLAAKPAPKFQAAIYVDKSLSRPTQELLVRMFTPKSVRSEKKLLATPAVVKFQKTANGFRTEIPGYLVAETKARRGRDGKQLVVNNVNFAEGSTWRVGENVAVSLKEPLAGWNWDLTGRNGTWSTWKWVNGQGHQSIGLESAAANRDTKGHASCSCCR